MSDAAKFAKLLYKELSIRGGTKRELYCSKEDKTRDHISLTTQDVIDIIKKSNKAPELAAFVDFCNGIPGLNIATGIGLRLNGKPFLCKKCGNIKWV